MVQDIRDVEKSLGKVNYKISKKSKKSLKSKKIYLCYTRYFKRTQNRQKKYKNNTSWIWLVSNIF